MFVIKNEKNNVQRILVGMLDAFSFFSKEAKSMMCSYRDEWSLIDQGLNSFKEFLEKLFFWNLWFFYLLEKHVLDQLTHTFFHPLFYRLLSHFYKTIIEWYCI